MKKNPVFYQSQRQIMVKHFIYYLFIIIITSSSSSSSYAFLCSNLKSSESIDQIVHEMFSLSFFLAVLLKREKKGKTKKGKGEERQNDQTTNESSVSEYLRIKLKVGCDCHFGSGDDCKANASSQQSKEKKRKKWKQEVKSKGKKEGKSIGKCFCK